MPSTPGVPGFTEITGNLPYYQSPAFWIPAGWVLLGLIILTGIVLTLDQLFSPISNVPYGIVAFFGPRGSGKSFAAVTFARRWRRYNPLKPVYTNLEKLELPGDGPVYVNCTPAQLTDARDALVLVDEAGVELSSWNFTDKTQRMVARWIAATRHYRVMLILTAHTPGTINNRIRDVMTEMIYMESWKGLKLFRGWVYESNATYGNKKNATHQIWVPMWPTTCRSYNTESLKIKADMQGVNMIGTDSSLPGVDYSSSSSSGNATETTTVPRARKDTSKISDSEVSQLAASIKRVEGEQSAMESGDISDTALDLSDPDKYREWLQQRAMAKKAAESKRTTAPKQPKQPATPADPWLEAIKKVSA